MNKAILLVRVSTERQSLDAQEQELFNLAIKDGYKKEDIICISEKESAIKLDELERNGLNRMKEAIENDNSIDCVYVWEISRIARRKKILFSILEYLTNRQIQLIIKEPSLKLLNEDKSINEGSETIFTLFSQIAESEMRNKKARFQRGKEKNALVGKYNGGVVKFGYSIDENNNYIINEEEANIVRKIFEMYVFDNKSQSQIIKELNETGILKSHYQKNFITKILNSKQYTGYSDLYGLKRNYPIIINEDLFNKARTKAEINKTKSDKSKNIYYCKSLIKCKCGSKYIANSISLQYICYERFHQNCSCGIDININLCDSIAWYHAKQLKFIQDINEFKNDNDKYEEFINNNITKINTAKLNIEKISKKIEKLDYDYYINNSIPEERFDKFKNIFKEEEKEITKNISKWQTENDNYNRLIRINNQEIRDIENLTGTNIVDKNITNLLSQTIDRIDSVTDDNVKKRIINDYIEEINIEEVERFKKKKVIIKDIKNNVSEYIIDVRSKKLYEGSETTYEEYIDFNNLEDNDEAKEQYNKAFKHDEIPNFVYFKHIDVSEEKIERKRNLVREIRKKQRMNKNNH